MLLAMGVSI